MTDMPIMRTAFRTTVSGDGKYEMVFRFPSMEAMHAADDEWHALSQPPEASEVEAVAYLKFWWDGQSPRTRVDLSEICEPWLDALKPTITPLYAHPPKIEASALREALAIAGGMSHKDDCTGSPGFPNVCGCGLTQLRLSLAQPAPDA